MSDISTDRSIQFWLNKRCGSPTSRPTYLSKINGFFQHMNIEPDALINQWKQRIRYDAALREKFIDEWTERIETYIYSSEFNGFASLTQHQTLTIIRSFFKAHRIPITPETPKHCYVKYHNRSITKEEIRQILEHANLRDHVFFLMMTESGLRPNTLAQLQYKHIKKDFQASKIPMKIDLPSELLKDRVEARWTFIGDDAFQKLRQYLKPRLPLQNDDPIFKPTRTLKYESIPPNTFSNIFSRIALKLGIAETTEKGKPKQIRLYCLRKFFRNNLRADRDYLEFWMGHKTTQSHYISRDIERHRQEYAAAYPNLRIYQSETPERISKLREELEASYQQQLEERDKKIQQLETAIRKLQPLIDLSAAETSGLNTDRMLPMPETKKLEEYFRREDPKKTREILKKIAAFSDAQKTNATAQWNALVAYFNTRLRELEEYTLQMDAHFQALKAEKKKRGK